MRARNPGLIQQLVDMVRLLWLPGTALLVCVDGLASYVTAFWVAFRRKVRTGKRGYLGNRGSVSDKLQRMNVEPRADSTSRE